MWSVHRPRVASSVCVWRELCAALPTDAAKLCGDVEAGRQVYTEGDASGSRVVKTRFLGFLIPKAVCHSLEQLHP